MNNNKLNQLNAHESLNLDNPVEIKKIQKIYLVI